MAAIRKRWRRIVTEHDLRPPLAADVIDRDVSDAVQNRRRIHEVLARADRADLAALVAALDDGCGSDGRFEPPMVALEGTLSIPFDEVATLRATISVAAPFASGDKPLRELLATVAELMRGDYLDGAGDVAENLTAQLREALAKVARGPLLETVHRHATALLVERRAYQKRALEGRPWIRGLLVLGRASEPVPIYLAQELVERLPLFQRWSVRVLAEADYRQDERETAAVALRARALATLPTSPSV
jgi:hypothetical protein